MGLSILDLIRIVLRPRDDVGDSGREVYDTSV